MIPKIAQNDAYLQPYSAKISERRENALSKERNLTGGKSLTDFATGFLYFGLHLCGNLWVFREFLPNATEVYIYGDFCQWKILPEYALSNIGGGVWEIKLPENKLFHGELYRLRVKWNGGEGDRLPSYSRYNVQDENTKIFSAQIYKSDNYVWKNASPRTDSAPIIYESHVGMATEEFRVGKFTEFTRDLIPYIKESGYNTLQLMAIQEHPYYGSFGYHVSNFFAVSSRFGTPDELKKLVDAAHGAGLRVIMDLVHSHSVKNTEEGLGKLDGSEDLYFHSAENRRIHPAWDSLCFDYGKNSVLHFLLSNCKFWLDEYHLDGFRFDGITSMLYTHHGLNRDFTEYAQYFTEDTDKDAETYLILANKLIHQVNPNAITIAEEMSGMPGIATSIEDGGYGFDYRLAMGTPDYWIKLIKETPQERWDVGNIFYELNHRRADERTIAYVESHDQALVGDKTVFFRLVDSAIYDKMSVYDRSEIVDDGIALHKIIRLLTLTTAGDGYLAFMGNEFGHPEWIDFPREGNGWSYSHARRQWSLLRDENLRFRYLAAFDREMLRLFTGVFAEKFPYAILQDTERQLLAYRRGGFLFVVNLSKRNFYQNFGIPTGAGKFSLVLSSDDAAFGGKERIRKQGVYFTSSIYENRPMENNYLKLDLPPLSALVFAREEVRGIYDI